ncbi:sensor histidine kinase [Collinsella sp. UBA1693]|uniref:sensor histidine kinase n=1 Tax=Collinsella sp. UBA1693 TaxID=1946385 RepID=UPI00257AFD2F|nr:ATP-binding protein [Collinsella sp. UBA1693]
MTTRHSLSQRVFATLFIMAVAVIAVFTVAGTLYLQGNLADSTHEELREETDVVAAALNQASDDYVLLDQIELGDTRVTLVADDGTVLYDSDESPADMANHADRPEIAEALADGDGISERSSSTMGETMLYNAVRLDDGSVIRLSKRQEGYISIFFTLLIPLLCLGAVAALLAWAAASREAKAIIAPLELVDLDHPKRNMENAYQEMVPMLERIENQRQELKRQMRVLADNDRMRREFTANITHELKTPLTAISGYAELIGSGMVASEDDQRDFAMRIYKEAGRLTSLVNDILTLSNLDEAEHSADAAAASVLGTREPVDLPRMLDSVYQRLEGVAAKQGVLLTVSSCPAVVEGVPRLLDELVYNLASNAIRYNKADGSVLLACGLNSDERPYIRVSDTGIGIAEEEREKIFERFYRVDKSRSKARGGTGLGLAIVKHAAVFHNAELNVESKLGEGTCITVTFPEAFKVSSF